MPAPTETSAATAGLSAEVITLINRAIAIGPAEAMRQDEISAGRIIVRPGDVDWFPRADWIDDVVVSRDGNEIRLIAILARNPGHGAFGRLVTGICAAGLVPVILAPMGDMPVILARWRWKTRQVGYGWTAETQVRPRMAWVTARVALASATRTTEGGRDV